MIMHKSNDYNNLPRYINDIHFTSVFLFWVYHYLYVSELLKVSLLIPLSFCIQTENVKMKREKYLKRLKVVDIIYYGSWTLLEGTKIVLFDRNFNFYESILIVISSIGLSIVLIFSLRRIRAYTKTLAT